MEAVGGDVTVPTLPARASAAAATSPAWQQRRPVTMYRRRRRRDRDPADIVVAGGTPVADDDEDVDDEGDEDDDEDDTGRREGDDVDGAAGRAGVRSAADEAPDVKRPRATTTATATTTTTQRQRQQRGGRGVVGGRKGATKGQNMKQLFLDLGQKNFGHVKCTTCGLLYARGEEADERTHAAYHAEAARVGHVFKLRSLFFLCPSRFVCTFRKYPPFFLFF